MAQSTKPDTQKTLIDPMAVQMDNPLTRNGPAEPKRRIINAKTILMTLSVILLIGSEILALGGALFWSVAKLLNFSLVLDYVFGAAVAIAALTALLIIIKLAFESETAPENQL